MRTTVRMSDDLLRQAKRRAAAEGCTLTALLEEGLMLVLSRPREGKRERVSLPISKARGGVLPGVDLNRSADLEAIMDRP